MKKHNINDNFKDGSPMFKEAYDYLAICKRFLFEGHSEGTTAKGRMWYRGDNIYSYNTLLAHYDRGNDTLLLDLGVKEYSNTSSKQARLLLDEVGSHTTVVTLRHGLDASIQENVVAMYEHILYSIKKHKRATSYHGKHTWFRNTTGTYKSLMHYIDTYVDGRKRTVTKYKNLAFEELFKAKMLGGNND